jgi:hypothetical protein
MRDCKPRKSEVKFVKLARESGADESEDSFVAMVKAISSTKPKKKKSQDD